jgi:hypothetical protein
MGRKSIWDTPSGNNSKVAGESQDRNEQPLIGAELIPSPVVSPKTVVEQLRVVAERKRNRTWETENRSFLIRGVPPKLTMAIKEIAADLSVKVDDVARAFIEFGLECLQKGEIKLTPVMGNQRLTLFPQTLNGLQRKTQPGWMEKIFDTYPPKKRSRKGKSVEDVNHEKAWRWQVSYRGIPEDVKYTLRQLHQQHNVPLGEVATALLGHSLEAYQTGRLVLLPQPCNAPNLAVKTQ